MDNPYIWIEHWLIPILILEIVGTGLVAALLLYVIYR